MNSNSASAPYISPKKGRRKYDKLEVSPNSLAACQRCKEKITKGHERVGIQGKHTTDRGIDVWRIQYWHGGCVGGSTKRELHLAPLPKVSKKIKANKKVPKKTKAKIEIKKKNTISPDEKKPRARTTANQHRSDEDESRKSPLKPRVRKQLEEDLRLVRHMYAEIQGCEDAEYKIFPNQSLNEMLTKLPTNKVELQRCWGIKEKRCAQYGDVILEIINGYLRQHHGTNNDVIISRSPSAIHQTSTYAAVSTAIFHSDSDDDGDVIETGKTLSVQEIVRQRVREAEARGEVLVIL